MYLIYSLTKPIACLFVWVFFWQGVWWPSLNLTGSDLMFGALHSRTPYYGEMMSSCLTGGESNVVLGIILTNSTQCGMTHTAKSCFWSSQIIRIQSWQLSVH